MYSRVERARYFYPTMNIVVVGLYESEDDIKSLKAKHYEVFELKDYSSENGIYGDLLEQELKWIRVPTYEECFKYYVRNTLTSQT